MLRSMTAPGGSAAQAPDAPPSNMRRLAAGGAITLVGAALTGLLGWLRNKGLALTLEPRGMGLYGQLWAYALYAGQIGSVGVGVAATKLVAERRQQDDGAGVRRVVGVAIAIPAVVGVAILAISLVLAAPVSDLLLGRFEFLLLALAAASVPFVAVQGSLQHTLQGFEDAWGQTVSYTLYGLSFTAFSIAGAVIDGVRGAAVGLLLGNVALVLFYAVRQRQLLRRSGHGTQRLLRTGLRHLRSRESRLLLVIGVASLAVAGAYGVADIVVRSVLLGSWGDVTAGFWFALLLVSAQFLTAVIGALSYFTAPMVARAAERRDRAQIRRLLDDSLRLALVVVAPLLVGIVLLSDEVVTVLFSSDFLPIAEQLPAMLGGELLHTVSWTLGVALIPLGFTRAWLAIALVSTLAFGVVGGLAAAEFGLDGAVAAWNALWGVSALATAGVLVRRGVWRPTRISLAAGAAATGAFVLAALVPGAVGAVLAIAAVLLLFVVGTRASERSAVRGYAAGALRRIRRRR
jgi:PST family polysaccharide transporter